MLKFFKFVFLGLIVLGLILVIVWNSLKRELFDYASNWVSKKAIEKSIGLGIDQLDLGLDGITADQVSVNYSYKMIPVVFRALDVQVYPHLLTYFRGNNTTNVRFKFLNGQISFQVRQFGSKTHIEDFKVVNVDLTQQKELGLAGFSSGLISMDSPAIVIDQRSKTLTIDRLIFRLQSLRHPGGFSIPSWMSGLPMDLRVPEIDLQELSFKLSSESLKALFEDIKLQSNLADLTSVVTLQGFNSRLLINSLEADVQLKPDFLNLYGDLLPLISNSALSKDSKQFKMRFTGYQQVNFGGYSKSLPKFDFYGRF